MKKQEPLPKNHAQALLQQLRRRLRVIGPIYLVAFFGVAALIYNLEHGATDGKFTKFSDAVWFCVVTLSTVGYGDVYPVTNAGRFVVGAFILFTLTTIGILLTAFNEAVLEVKRMEEAGLIPTQMQGHVIVCGWSPIVRVALSELVAAERQVALICERADDVPAARQWTVHGDVFVTSGEPTDEVLRERLHAGAAETAVIASSDDTLNLITALNLRTVNPKMRIIVALQRDELRATMMASGVTYVASPNELSGRLVASAAFEPEVAHFIEDVSTGASGTHDLQQFPAAGMAGLTIAELRKQLDEMDGPLLVAVARRDGDEYRVHSHPARDLKLAADDHVIVLTDDAQADRLAEKYKVKQGR
jgi:voltage-gated potassium channel